MLRNLLQKVYATKWEDWNDWTCVGKDKGKVCAHASSPSPPFPSPSPPSLHLSFSPFLCLPSLSELPALSDRTVNDAISYSAPTAALRLALCLDTLDRCLQDVYLNKRTGKVQHQKPANFNEDRVEEVITLLRC